MDLLPKTQCIILAFNTYFLKNLIFQLLNHFIFPSSMLVRLVNIYMFRCNKKILFVTSSFVGWLIGHILFIKWVGLVLVWMQQNNSIRFNVLIRSNKYLVSELRNSMARIFSILLFITCRNKWGFHPIELIIHLSLVNSIFNGMNYISTISNWNNIMNNNI
jgi:hypothetical protein